MHDILAGLNVHANLITACATVILAVLTGTLWFENRRLRKAGSSPEVVAYLLPHPDGNGAIQFVLSNVGRGPAFDVAFTLKCDPEDFAAHKALLENDSARPPISVLPQDESVRALIGISFELAGNVDKGKIGPLKPFKVEISYSDAYGRRMARVSVLDITQFSGLRGILNKSNEKRVSDSLKKMEKQMAVIARNSAHLPNLLDITTLDDRYVQKANGDPKKSGNVGAE